MMGTADLLEKIARGVEQAVPGAECHIQIDACQIIATFAQRPGIEVALLIPSARFQVQKGYLEQDLYTDILFSIKRIANG